MEKEKEKEKEKERRGAMGKPVAEAFGVEGSGERSGAIITSCILHPTVAAYLRSTGG